MGTTSISYNLGSFPVLFILTIHYILYFRLTFTFITFTTQKLNKNKIRLFGIHVGQGGGRVGWVDPASTISYVSTMPGRGKTQLLLHSLIPLDMCPLSIFTRGFCYVATPIQNSQGLALKMT